MGTTIMFIKNFYLSFTLKFGKKKFKDISTMENKIGLSAMKTSSFRSEYKKKVLFRVTRSEKEGFIKECLIVQRKL